MPAIIRFRLQEVPLARNCFYFLQILMLEYARYEDNIPIMTVTKKNFLHINSQLTSQS